MDEEVVKIALSRGIFFPCSEVFGDSFAGFWEYGPIGIRIFNNIVDVWRRTIDEMGGLEISGSIVLPRKVLQASGHEKNFFDVSAKCSKCNYVYRIDKLLSEKENGKNFEGLALEEYGRLIDEKKLTCPNCGGKFEEPKKTGMMFPVSAGYGKNTEAYLRPEACQSIFLDFRRVYELYGKKLPLAIAQVGKAFRNEISPRNNLLRQREFYQNDIEIFFLEDSEFDVKAVDSLSVTIYDEKTKKQSKTPVSSALKENLIENRATAYAVQHISVFLGRLGFSADDVRFRKLNEEKAFYAKEAFDVEIKKDDEWIEVIACNNRDDYDLRSYESGGANIIKIDGKTPKIMEISAGTDRLMYLLLHNSLKKDKERDWLKLNYVTAPFLLGVFPLMAKDELVKAARNIKTSSKRSKDIQYSDVGSIGKRYRRADEIGVPLCATVDYQTLEDSTVTIRDRDSMKQFRIKSSDIDSLLFEMPELSFQELENKYAVKTQEK